MLDNEEESLVIEQLKNDIGKYPVIVLLMKKNMQSIYPFLQPSGAFIVWTRNSFLSAVLTSWKLCSCGCEYRKYG